MKKLMKSLAFIAVAAMGLTACENSFDVQDEVNKVSYEISVEADATRSVFGDKEDGVYPTLWSGNEVVKVSLAEADVQDATLTVTDGGQSAKMSVELAADATGTLYAVVPYNTTSNYSLGGFGKVNSTYHDFYVTIPVEQTPLVSSVDESAQLLFAECEVSNSMSMTFKHIAAYGKMTIKNFTPNIKSIALISPVNFVGASGYYYYAGDNAGEIANMKSTTLTLNADNVENNVFWFTCAPVGTLTDNMTIIITDDEGNNYTKELAAADKLAFEQGKVSNFSVDMTGIEADSAENIEWVNNAYNLVPTVAGLNVGDKVVIVASKYNKAMGAQNSNNRASVDVVKNTENNTVTFDTRVEVLTVSAGVTAGNFSFITSGNKYIYAAGGTSSNYLKEETTLSTKSSWTVSIVEGVATIKAEDTTVTRNWLRYNDAATYGDLFSCYASGQTDVCIYKLVGEYTPKAPVIILGASDASIAADAISGSATITAQYATGWTITATSSESWIKNLVYDATNSAITFDSEVNETTEERSATITVTATNDDYDEIVTDTFVVKQNGQVSGDVTLGAAYSYTFTSQMFSAEDSKDLEGLSWALAFTKAASSTYFSYDSTKGQQLGSSSNSYSQVTLTTTAYEGGVQTIKVNTSGASSTNAKLKVTVGGTQIGSQINLTNTAADYTFTSDEMLVGDIVLTWTQASKKAIYVKSIAIN